MTLVKTKPQRHGKQLRPQRCHFEQGGNLSRCKKRGAIRIEGWEKNAFRERREGRPAKTRVTEGTKNPTVKTR